MKNNNALSFIFLLFVFISCQSNQNKVDFSGHIITNTESEISLYQVFPNNEVLIDSSPIKNGRFRLTGEINSEGRDPSFYKLVLSKTNFILTIASPGEKLVFNIDSAIMVKSYTVKGGKDADLMQQLNHQLKLFGDSVLALEQIYFKNQYNDSVKSGIESTYMDYINNHKVFLSQFIEKNPHSLSTLTAFYQKYGRRTFFPEKENISLLRTIISSLESKYPNNKNVIYIKNRIESITTTEN